MLWIVRHLGRTKFICVDSKIVGEVLILVNYVVCFTIPSVPKCIFLSCKCWKGICENGKHSMKCFTKVWRTKITQITSIVTILQSSSLNASNICCNKLLLSRLQRSCVRLLHIIVTINAYTLNKLWGLLSQPFGILSKVLCYKFLIMH